MLKHLLLGAALSIALAQPASAHHRHHHWRHHYRAKAQHQFSMGGGNVARARAQGLPWCGAFAADLFHKVGAEGRRLWVAANWRFEGHATSPHPGAVVVWRHHVGKLISHVAGDVWVVLSGNDGHSVRERPRSVRGAIAFRDIS